MIIPEGDIALRKLLDERLLELEECLKSDVMTYFGPIIDGMEGNMLSVIEGISKDKKRDKLTVILTTNGGSAHTVERYVNIIRYHYKEVDFIIPDYAYSAGTIFCMSGDNIFMDYYSVLGPVDPQVQNKEGNWVPALGYLDKVNEMIKKASDDNLTQAEFFILKDIDLAELRGYEQAKALTMDLLQTWLVQYKFKNWEKHQTDPKKKGQKVTKEEKIKRAAEIADKLSDNNRWKSHGRPINIQILEKELKLKIEDYSKESEMRSKIRSYYSMSSDYSQRYKRGAFVHTRKFI